MFRGAAVATDDRGRRTDCFKKGAYNISIVRTASIFCRKVNSPTSSRRVVPRGVSSTDPNSPVFPVSTVHHGHLIAPHLYCQRTERSNCDQVSGTLHFPWKLLSIYIRTVHVQG